MPETAVHKNRQSFFRKYKIRLPENRLPASPTSDAVGAKNSDERQFGSLVPVSANLRHHVGTLRLCKDIGHLISGGLPPMFRRQFLASLNFMQVSVLTF
jgi:hypothetical protein